MNKRIITIHLQKRSYKQNKMDDSVYMENYEVLQKQINEIMILIRQPINMEEVWQLQKYGQ